MAWLITAISLILPWIGLGTGLLGLTYVASGTDWGWPLVAFGGVLILLDLLIDYYWAHPSVSQSDEPELNRRGHQLIGRAAIVEEPIVHGRGKVRIGDSLWTAEGPDAARGATVRVAAVQHTVLVVDLERP
jgi:inner membrane protein